MPTTASLTQASARASAQKHGSTVCVVSVGLRMLMHRREGLTVASLTQALACASAQKNTSLRSASIWPSVGAATVTAAWKKGREGRHAVHQARQKTYLKCWVRSCCQEVDGRDGKRAIYT
jgi:hypothetical protein